MKPFKAIAAMSLNRVIGQGNQLPWHLPDDFRWFKQTTTGHILLMGRKTFQSVGRPLPNRTTIVLSRNGFSHPGVVTIRSLQELELPENDPREIFVCGGAQIYAELLPRCNELFLTVVQREVAGDAFFPWFEDCFELKAELAKTAEFRILHYCRRLAERSAPGGTTDQVTGEPSGNQI